MNEILEIRGKIYEVVDGQVTKIKVDDTIFEIKSPERRMEVTKSTVERPLDSKVIPEESPEDIPYVEEIKTKFCPKCGKTKHITDFYSCVSRPDKLQSYCKVCMNTYTSDSQKKKPIEKKDRGETVGKMKKCYIQSSILNDIKQGLSEGKDTSQLMEIVNEY
ncbi:unnamed protein product, partial [marine sediment metagenome]